MRRFGFFYAVPVLLLFFAVFGPLLSGEATLYKRDVLTAHYPMKASQAAALARGEVPLVDLLRAGGQPLLGNPNGLPLYPSNLLYLVAPTLWAMNAHFWLHVLLAAAAFYWLGRAFGLGRPAALAGGVFYASSGFFLSLLNLYNLVAGAALAPALVAAGLDAWTSERRRPWVVAALVWALLILAGDPLFAVLALGAALAAALFRYRQAPRGAVAAGVALVAGSALALPMLVEFLRILPLSFRGYWPSSSEAVLAQSLDPRTAVEWLLPLFFGRPDLDFWGFRFYGGVPPLFYSLAPGLLVLALLPLAPAGPARRFGLALGGLGIFLALGRFNPLVAWLAELPGASLLRYPVKFFLWTALGTALLAALGFERLERGGGRRRLGLVLGVLALLYLAGWVFFSFSALPTPVRERPRWAGICLISLVLLAPIAGALHLARRRPALGGSLLLAVHAAAQILFLMPLIEHDDARFYREPPALLAKVAPGERIVHGDFKDLFGPQRLARLPDAFPDASGRWLARAQFAGLQPFAGAVFGRRYEFNPSPEGLDSFFTVALVQALGRLDDASRLRLLAASGVDVLLLGRPLEPGARSAVRRRARHPTALGDVFVYELQDAAPKAFLATTAWREPGLGEALRRLAGADFAPRTMAVLAAESGRGESLREFAPGRARILAESAAEITIDVDVEVEVEEGTENAAGNAAGNGGGLLVVQRTFLGIYRATVDGAPAVLEPANIHRMAVEVPPGRHQVTIRADRRPTRLAWAGAAMGLVALLVLGLRERRGAP